MKHVGLAVIGATAAGVGAALACGKNACIFEKEMLMGAEFGAALYAKPCPNDPHDELREDWTSVGILNEHGIFHPTTLSARMAKRVEQAGIETHLFTRILGAYPCGNGFALEYYDTEGTKVCMAENVLVTTHDAQPICSVPCAWKKYLCAELCPGEKDIADLRGEGWDIVCGTLEHERIFRMALDNRASWSEARMRFYECWNHIEHFGWKIAGMASSFAYVYENPICYKLENGVWYLPSASYGCPTAAWRGGTVCAINTGWTNN